MAKSDSESTEQICFRVPVNLADQIRREADRERRSVSNYLYDRVARILEREQLTSGYERVQA